MLYEREIQTSTVIRQGEIINRWTCVSFNYLYECPLSDLRTMHIKIPTYPAAVLQCTLREDTVATDCWLGPRIYVGTSEDESSPKSDASRRMNL